MGLLFVLDSVNQPLYNIVVNSLCWSQSKSIFLCYRRFFFVHQNTVIHVRLCKLFSGSGY